MFQFDVSFSKNYMFLCFYVFIHNLIKFLSNLNLLKLEKNNSLLTGVLTIVDI